MVFLIAAAIMLVGLLVVLLLPELPLRQHSAADARANEDAEDAADAAAEAGLSESSVITTAVFEPSDDDSGNGHGNGNGGNGAADKDRKPGSAPARR